MENEVYNRQGIRITSISLVVTSFLSVLSLAVAIYSYISQQQAVNAEQQQAEIARRELALAERKAFIDYEFDIEIDTAQLEPLASELLIEGIRKTPLEELRPNDSTSEFNPIIDGIFPITTTVNSPESKVFIALRNSGNATAHNLRATIDVGHKIKGVHLDTREAAKFELNPDGTLLIVNIERLTADSTFDISFSTTQSSNLTELILEFRPNPSDVTSGSNANSATDLNLATNTVTDPDTGGVTQPTPPTFLNMPTQIGLFFSIGERWELINFSRLKMLSTLDSFSVYVRIDPIEQIRITVTHE